MSVNSSLQQFLLCKLVCHLLLEYKYVTYSVVIKLLYKQTTDFSYLLLLPASKDERSRNLWALLPTIIDKYNM